MAFGLLVSALCDNEQDAIQLALGSFYPNLLLSGIIWPLEGMPQYLRSGRQQSRTEVTMFHGQVHQLPAAPDLRLPGAAGRAQPGLGDHMAPRLPGLPRHHRLDRRPPRPQHCRPPHPQIGREESQLERM